MAEQFLHRADIVTGLQKMSGEGMAQSVGRGQLNQTRIPNRLLHRPLHGLILHFQAVANRLPAGSDTRLLMDRTLTQADRGLLKHPEFHNVHVIRMLALAELGDGEATRLAVELVKTRLPFFQPELLGTRFANAPDMEKAQRTLRKAGF